MNDFSRARASLSRIFETVDRLVIGLKFLKLVMSRLCLFNNRVIKPCFMEFGKRPFEKERFAKWAIRIENKSPHCLNNEHGRISRGDVLHGADRMTRSTSIYETGLKFDNLT